MAGIKQPEKQMAIVGSADIRPLKKKPDEVETSLKTLQDLLWTLFQFDAADLDFGIYRIMNKKRAAVKGFIDTDLPNVVDEEFGKVTIDQRSAIDEKVKALKKEITEKLGTEAVIGDSINPAVASLPIAKTLGEQLIKMLEARDAATISQEFRRDIYNHIYAFFSRYYDAGDFMSKRRRSTAKEQYAVPYNGEEVILHWTNKDQYYIKTADHFRNFTVKDPGEHYSIHFRITTARQIIGNAKETQDNYFVLHEGTDAISYNAEIRELVILFQYRPIIETEKNGLTKKDKIQDFFVDEAVKKTLSTKLEKGLIDLLTKIVDKEKGTIWLKKNLISYVKENKTDYFIHKDLRRFLGMELDFYIKNEMFHLDDLGTEREVPLGPYVNRVRVMKAVSLKIIDFLAQIEDFQKRLWEKKKFVITSHYCMTLDRVPEEFYNEIITNGAQLKEWKTLYGIEEGSWKTLSAGKKGVDFLKEHPFLVLDTKFFNDETKYPGFKDRLLASIDDLDDAIGGLMVRSENWQALNLLHERYRGSVKCIFIDPPYNTGSDEFLYKDNYQHSSWLASLYDRVQIGKSFLTEDGVLFSSIDDFEISNYLQIFNQIFTLENKLATLIWNRGHSAQAGVFMKYHEYVLALAKNAEKIDLIRKGEGTIDAGAMKKPSIRHAPQDFTFPAGTLFQAPDNTKFEGRWGNVEWVELVSGKVKIKDGKLTEPVTLKAAWTQKNQMKKFYEGIRPIYDSKGQEIIDFYFSSSGKLKERKKREATSLPTTLPDYGSAGTNTTALAAILGKESPFTPKPVKMINDFINWFSDEDSEILDYYSGSGTTAHAVLNLNREDGGSRKYILVEMAGYFDSVLKPRIEKVIYSSEWKEGKPQNSDGISHIFKYISLEQYEDSLNNIEFQVAGTVERKLSEMEDYFLRYSLDFETQDSPCRFNIAKLERPFEYTLWIMRDGVRQKEIVDLVETFNYLLGLHVIRLRRFDENGTAYRVVHGEKSGKTITVIWRTTTNLDLEKDKKFIEGKLLKNKDFNAEQVFINGDFFVENALPIESKFQDCMNVGFKSVGA